MNAASAGCYLLYLQAKLRFGVGFFRAAPNYHVATNYHLGPARRIYTCIIMHQNLLKPISKSSPLLDVMTKPRTTDVGQSWATKTIFNWQATCCLLQTEIRCFSATVTSKTSKRTRGAKQASRVMMVWFASHLQRGENWEHLRSLRLTDHLVATSGLKSVIVWNTANLLVMLQSSALVHPILSLKSCCKYSITNS